MVAVVVEPVCVVVVVLTVSVVVPVVVEPVCVVVLLVSVMDCVDVVLARGTPDTTLWAVRRKDGIPSFKSHSPVSSVQVNPVQPSASLHNAQQPFAVVGCCKGSPAPTRATSNIGTRLVLSITLPE